MYRLYIHTHIKIGTIRFKMGIEAPFGMQQSPAVNSNTFYCLQKKKIAAIKHALCAMHLNDSHKRLRARGIPAATSKRKAYVWRNHSVHTRAKDPASFSPIPFPTNRP